MRANYKRWGLIFLTPYVVLSRRQTIRTLGLRSCKLLAAVSKLKVMMSSARGKISGHCSFFYSIQPSCLSLGYSSTAYNRIDTLETNCKQILG